MADTSCDICGKSSSKYRCPACGKRTCSLRCVKCHKVQLQCSGVRCKTEFLPIEKYTDRNLLSDYKFLENVDRLVYTSVHDSHSKNRRHNSQILHFCRKAKQSGVNLKLMPVGMSKRTENASVFSRRENCLLWTIRWMFPQADVEYVDRRVSELEVVRDVLKKYIDPEKADAVHKQRCHELLKFKCSQMRGQCKPLKKYCEIGPQGVCVFLKIELLPASEARYHQLDISKTLKDCLAQKTVIEFPTFHVVLPDKTAGYVSTSQVP